MLIQAKRFRDFNLLSFLGCRRTFRNLLSDKLVPTSADHCYTRPFLFLFFFLVEYFFKENRFCHPTRVVFSVGFHDIVKFLVECFHLLHWLLICDLFAVPFCCWPWILSTVFFFPWVLFVWFFLFFFLEIPLRQKFIQLFSVMELPSLFFTLNQRYELPYCRLGLRISLNFECWARPNRARKDRKSTKSQIIREWGYKDIERYSF